MSDYDFESYMKDPELTAGIECFKAEDWKGAFDHYLTSSMNGNPEAQVRLGGLFYYGRGTEADPKKALMWYRKAAVAGNAAAQNEVGVMFHLGNGTQRSDAKAFEWLKASANQGYAQAFYNLGTMYERGDGVPTDYKQAVELYALDIAGTDVHGGVLVHEFIVDQRPDHGLALGFQTIDLAHLLDDFLHGDDLLDLLAVQNQNAHIHPCPFVFSGGRRGAAPAVLRLSLMSL